MKKVLLLLLCGYVTNVLGNCNPGYILENGACVNIDECTTGTHTCATDGSEVCTDTDGGFTCGCASTHFLNPNADGCQLCPNCLPKTCDASAAPTNGGVGDCTNDLADGATCQPTCDIGYVVSGTSSCSQGTLTAATCNAFTINDQSSKDTDGKKAGRKADFAAIFAQINGKGSIHRQRRQARHAYKQLLAGGESFNVARDNAIVSNKFKLKMQRRGPNVELEIRPYKAKTAPQVDDCNEADLDLKEAPSAYDIPLDHQETALICRDTTPVMKLKMTVDGGDVAKDEYEASCWGGSAWDAAVAKSSDDGEDEITCPSGAKFYVNSGSGTTCAYAAPTNGVPGACGISLGEGESCTHTCNAGFEFTTSATCIDDGSSLVFTEGTCTACAADEHSDNNVCVADSDVASCPAGQGQQDGTDPAQDDRSCGNCPAEHYSPDGSIVCTQYSAGSTAAAKAACVADNKPFIDGGNNKDHSCGDVCTGGSRVTLNNDATSCDHCDPGYGNDGSGSACQQCPSNSYNDVISPIAQNCNLKECPLGEGSGTDVGADHISDDCVVCAAGTFSDDDDEGQCESIPDGSECSATGTSGGCKETSACAANQHSTGGAACADDTKAVAGDCADGEAFTVGTSNTANDGSCSACAANQHSTGGAACADDTKAVAGDCVAGEYFVVGTSNSADDGSCTQCAAGVGAAGTVDDDSDPSTPCTPCGATEYSTAGLTACLSAEDQTIDDPALVNDVYVHEAEWDVPTCASGEFKHLDGDSITCEACSKALYASTYTKRSTSAKHPHGKCCSNSRHKACLRMVYEYRKSCSSAVCAA